MAVYVTIERAVRVDHQIIVEALYRDDSGRLKQPRSFAFPSDVTMDEVKQTVVRTGFDFFKADDTIEKELAALISQTFDVVTGDPADPKEFDLGGPRLAGVQSPPPGRP